MRLTHLAGKRALLGAAVGALTAATSAAAQPSSVDLTGTIWDFSKAHADFGVPVTAGHYAGNVGMALDAGGRPVYTGTGYRVATEWKDTAGRNIAPHLFGDLAGSCIGAPVGVSSTSNFQIRNQSEVRGYIYNTVAPGGVPAIVATNSTSAGDCDVTNNSALYGDALVGVGGNPNTVVVVSPNSDVFGTLGNLSAPLPGPVFAAPTGMAASTGNLTFNAGTTEIATDWHVGTLTITGSARVVIKPATHVVIFAEGGVTIDANGNASAGLYIGAGASLDLYVRGELNLSTRAEALDLDPARFRIFMLDAELNMFGNAPARLRAQVFSKSTLEMTQAAEFWGTFWGTQLDMENNSMAYIDMSLTKGDIDKAGVAGPAGGSITSAATFGEWFSDVLGTNTSKSHTITLNRTGGVYEYLDDAFYPIDGGLNGNEGDPHNYSFTYAIEAKFTSDSCTGQFVEFTGADDLWIFIDGDLAMDLGGIQPITVQYLDLERIGLVDGTEYELRIFFAQRSAASSRFRLRTNLVLESSVTPVDVTASYD